MERGELTQQAKVVDMMLTMHSILADRYRRRAQILDILLVAVSTVLVALTFLDPQILIHFKTQPESARLLIGLCSILVFLLSIVALIVDWKGKARQHREAFKTLAGLKSEWRGLVTAYDESDDRYKAEFSRRSALILGNLVPIPDSQFNRLKARHHRKVMLSKMISTHPGSSITVLRLRLWYRRNRKALGAELPDEKER
jgi:hypothetical protein